MDYARQSRRRLVFPGPGQLSPGAGELLDWVRPDLISRPFSNDCFHGSLTAEGGTLAQRFSPLPQTTLIEIAQFFQNLS